MKRGVWGSMVLVAVAMNGCPSPTQCAQGTYNEALRRCVGDCRDPSSPSCYDTGVATDASDVATLPDVPSSMMEAGPSCMAPQQLCGGSCVDTTANVAHCGSCDPCASMAGATASCAMGACTYTCLPGFERSGTSCDVIAPRPIWPPGTSTVTSLRPTFKWVNPAGVDGARVQVCRDRACTMVVATIDAAGESARPMADLPTSTALFWRLQGRVASTTGTRTSPTWQLRTRAVGATVDTAHGVDLDVNGDGFSDLAISSASSVVFHQGSASGVSSTASKTISIETMSFVLPLPLHNVSAAGDVDGDGFGDVLVGGPANALAGMSNAGCVWLLRGSPSGLMDASAPLRCGARMNEGLGTAVAGIGDINADGFADVAIAAPNSYGSTGTGSGVVFVVRGSARGLDGVGARELIGSSSEVLGSAISTSVDLNGDSVSDMVLGSPGAAPGGAARVYYGSAMGPPMAPSITLLGPSSADSFGASLAAGDFNGDGYGDLAVGVPLATTTGIGSDAGSVWIFAGRSSGVVSGATIQLRATYNSSFFGHAIASAGDVNRDGFDDLVVGAPTARVGGQLNSGAAYLFRGSMSGLPADATQTVDGAPGDGMGYGVGGGGDLNGDGYCDVAMGAPNADPMGANGGGIVVIYNGGVSTLSRVTTLSSTMVNARLGVVIARAPVRSVYQHRACLARR